ncbi:Cysteine-rich/transmembrane domain A-like protein [Quillaja saponaria]|uniref:Cysteine-rich/transmembrane domain A-like protein n=1 Tax=Quillaja saponaria TaxID=32244 RepID=A0AAD7PBM0_QUISA|nr:Cysteine-rich/transmembrane domain A-like protein [Quillaja saponaria]
MSQCNQQQSPIVAYPPPSAPVAGHEYPAGLYVTAPPPRGYPTMNNSSWCPQNNPPSKTTTRGDGFWKGCCAALCCCCVLDWCF